MGPRTRPRPSPASRNALDRDELVQAALELDLVVIGHERVHELDILGRDVIDVQAERRGVAHDDGAVVAVARRFVLLALPADAGHPDEVDVLVDEVHDMAVRELAG